MNKRKEMSIDLNNNYLDESNEENFSLEQENEKINKIDEVINVSDDEIKESFDTIEQELINKQDCKKTKKTIRQRADEVVNAFLNDRSDKNWTKLQEFFWFGIKAFAKKYVRNDDDAYDMTIETFIRSLENIDSYDPEKAKFSTWLWTICKNNCLYLLNQRDKMPMIDNDISEIYDSEMLSTAYTQNIENKEYKINKDGILENLTADDINIELYNVSIKEMHNIGGLAGQILEMKFIDNLKIREIADKLQMNESTVKNYLYKSKENLSRILKINHKELYDMYIDLNSGKESAIYA